MNSSVPKQSGRVKALAALALALALTGCNEDMSDLRRYVSEIKARPGGRIEPLPEMKVFSSYTYPDDPGRNPFERLSFAEPERPATAEEIASGPRPDPTRPREPLEQFTLDSLSYVGTLQRDSERWALIRDPSGVIHRVQPGNHLGQNYGEIIDITPTAVRVRELIRTQRGTWVERNAAIALNE